MSVTRVTPGRKYRLTANISLSDGAAGFSRSQFDGRLARQFDGMQGSPVVLDNNTSPNPNTTVSQERTHGRINIRTSVAIVANGSSDKRWLARQIAVAAYASGGSVATQQEMEEAMATGRAASTNAASAPLTRATLTIEEVAEPRAAPVASRTSTATTPRTTTPTAATSARPVVVPNPPAPVSLTDRAALGRVIDASDGNTAANNVLSSGMIRDAITTRDPLTFFAIGAVVILIAAVAWKATRK